MEGFSPSTDLTEIRDRLLGILLGAGISWVIHVLLWPEAEGEALRQRLARLSRAVATSLRRGRTNSATTDPQLWSELNDSQDMLARVILEPSWQSGEGQQEVLTLRLQEILAAIRVIVLTSDSLQTELAHARLKPELRLALLEFCEQAAACLERYADWLAGQLDAALMPTTTLDESWYRLRRELEDLEKSPLPSLLNELVREIEHLKTQPLFDRPARP